jgi:hypothetical protein
VDTTKRGLLLTTLEFFGGDKEATIQWHSDGKEYISASKSIDGVNFKALFGK